MQLITAVVPPSRMDAVLSGLRRFGVLGWNLSTAYADGLGLVGGLVGVTRLDLVAANADTADVVRVIMRAAAPAAVRVWVTPVDLIIRISTGESGPAAVQ
jgi:nitrogen regulatory protein P-II 1